MRPQPARIGSQEGRSFNAAVTRTLVRVDRDGARALICVIRAARPLHLQISALVALTCARSRQPLGFPQISAPDGAGADPENC